jgi:hypothetical protein
MDERHHHENDVHGVFASGRAARKRLAELDEVAERERQRPALRASFAEITAAKALVAGQIRDLFGEAGHSARCQMTVAEFTRRHGPEFNGPDHVVPGDYAIMVERLGQREVLTEQLRSLSLELNQVHAALSALGPETARGDMQAHRDDLSERIRAAGGTP